MLLSAMLFLIFACKNNSNKTSEQLVAESENTHEEHAQDSLTLNNGVKWKVVPKMLAYIRNMEKAIMAFDTNSTKDYKRLAEEIDTNIRELTANCTMEGPAHDALHLWLVPFIELSEEFDVAENPEDQERIYQEFKTAMENFNIYFE